ncbi:MAG: bifunctional aldolase/short-chain dehydrogenase [Pseudomonadota bacterium]
MKNLYDQDQARDFVAANPGLDPDLALRIYTTRLLGGDPDLVLHGGGNTSVKLTVRDPWGEPVDVLYVKGSGWDMARIGPEGFTPLDLDKLKRVRELETLSDLEMENQLLTRRLRWDAPAPSVDALSHAFLPRRFVDHTHADAVLALTNQDRAGELIREALGPKAAVMPYAHPGFPQGRALANLYEAHPEAEVLVILGHGLFTYGDTAREAYEKMIEYVDRAEAFIRARLDLAPRVFSPGGREPSLRDQARLVQVLRGRVGRAADACHPPRYAVEIRAAADLVAASLSAGAEGFCRSGVLTPDHAIRTRNKWVFLPGVPSDDAALEELVQAGVGAYAEDYERYFREHASALDPRPERLEPTPRVFLVAGLGLVALGPTRKEALIAADVAEHAVRTKVGAAAAGRYRPVSEGDVFELEHWFLEQRKLKSGDKNPLSGQTALVTGAGGAIALGVADRLLMSGAAVALADVDLARLNKVRDILADRHGPERVVTAPFDVTDFKQVEEALDLVSTRLGGLDILVPNAGLAHVAALADLDPDQLDRLYAVNLKGTFHAIKASAPIFKRQGLGGNIVIISSKNVFDPGASFGAYSATKAGAHQLGKIAALELAPLGVRVNMINPDAVFGQGEISSKLWDLVGPDRMRSRGLDPCRLQEYYQGRNLLTAQVTAEHVGAAVVFFATNQTPTTGASLPVDGGVQGAFPR